MEDEKKNDKTKVVLFHRPCSVLFTRKFGGKKKRLAKLEFGQIFLYEGEPFMKIFTEYGVKNKCNVALHLSKPWVSKIFEYDTMVEPKNAKIVVDDD